MPQSSKWYPSPDQLKDPGSLERAFREVLKMHYDLQDRHNELLKKVNTPAEKTTGPPPGSGPTDTQICGLYVAPVDAGSLADGVKLTWVKKSGNFQFI